MSTSLDSEAAVVMGTFAVLPSGVYTVASPTGHRTFTIERQGEGEDFAPGKRVVYLLTGQDTESPDSWLGFGFVSDVEGHSRPISVWPKRRGPRQNPTEYEIYARMLVEMLLRGRRVFRGPGGEEHDYQVLLSKRCLRCDRRLTTPESITAGIGPECAKKGL